MTIRITLIMTCLAGISSLTGACRTEPSVPRDVFAPWDGTWEGRFFVKDGQGRTLTELQVVQTYRSESPNRQLGFFREVDVATRAVTTATATNSHDGRGMLCEVSKSNGDHVVHQGRWTGEAIEWSRSTPEAKELFVERIVTATGGATVYEIRGWGEYGGGDRLHFEGRYQKR